jgi:hypothetical protein
MNGHMVRVVEVENLKVWRWEVVRKWSVGRV